MKYRNVLSKRYVFWSNFNNSNILLTEEVKVEGYKFYHNRGCFEHDEIFSGQFDESDIDECKNICDEDATCISFEYWGQGNPNEYKGEGLCHVSSTCTSKMSKPKSVNNMTCNLYVKGKIRVLDNLKNKITKNLLQQEIVFIIIRF